MLSNDMMGLGKMHVITMSVLN